jgi:TatD DNase family protein
MIDSHCHLDPQYFAADLADVLARARAAGVEAFVCVGVGRTLDAPRAAVALAAAEPDVFATVGVHPHDVGTMAEADWDALDELARRPRVVGIGETGLDYYYDHSPREAQQAAYRRFVAMARAARLPVVSHVRDAHEGAAAILREEQAGDGVIHCFSGGVADARAYLDLGQHLSFSGILTFKNAGDIREAAAFAPLDRILIETDAPYLAPIPYRGKKNEPAYIAQTLAALASVRGLTPAEVDAATTANARRLFRLPSPVGSADTRSLS